MSSTTQRMQRAEAVEIARRFVELIDGTYSQLVIAGSIRRRLPTCGDIEIVAVPVVETVPTLDMFGEETSVGTVDLLDAHLTMLLDKGKVQKRPRSDGKTFWGPSAKYLTFEGAPIDLFTPSADRFGLILAIRTGPAAFSNALVTPQGTITHAGRQGMLPRHLRVQGGHLTYRVSGQRIPTPDERAFFGLIGRDWEEPWSRV